jgi:hypothetical protein
MPKLKTCRGCGEKYARLPTHPPFQTWCTVDCGIAVARAKQRKKIKKQTRAWRLEHRTRGEWIKQVQKIYNSYIRARDERDNQPCISCGKHFSEPFNGQLWDAGHFLSVGSHPELRFIESNCHRQHSRENRGAAKHARNDRTVSEQYRTNLIDRIGITMVEWLEGPHDAAKHSIEDLKWLHTYYKERTKQATKECENVL